MSKRRGISALAAVAVLVAVVVALPSGGDGPAEPVRRPSNSTGQGQTAPGDVPVVDLKLDRLQHAHGELEEPGRDPFRFRARPAPPPVAVTAPVTRPTEFVPPAPSGPPPPPPIAVKYFGILGVQGERVAVFSDPRGHTFHGKEGDIIEGRYRVLRIGSDSVELAHLDGRGRQTIRLTGQ